ncbi:MULTISPECIES: YceH family protein [unclassified Pseudomonas]|uniref:YceH family protein n=1 Tax=unclassified Pseudomonas TaxID=196821 RepID=UPI000BC47B21|nr:MULTISPECIES: DUF480 domain-containing protein [unclassified Pseudomonas]PVZ13555.1 hypothetical protein F474_02637 [Pseudomonas sp. URIL14HWK12:I12]PVZ23861.1 hypothetical protein F470_02292 [Pseudomonas sp. URIL14HWK12:I10]PVZ33500.1 hypothetical protein F472_02970 [Pseudomonas sp. URIL14HWK12:I11]SNZ11819.1 hypothetical protein SAMN05660463_01955 [Pseudomonas sp. URIL14HWK12:I9]
MTDTAPRLSVTELRVLGSLIEKQATNADTYPLTLNALVLACNQKTSREPVTQLSPGEVGHSLRQLEQHGMAHLVMGSRADRWEHRLDKALELTPPQLALLGLLFLRGPQTPNELLTRSLRLYPFDDSEQVVHQLERLVARDLAVLIERRPGQREDRYTHALGDLADAEAIMAARGAERAASHDSDRLETLEARVAALEARLAALEG